MRQVLVIAPHTDDAEIGAGGYIARLIEEGASVHIVSLSACEESLPDTMAAHLLRLEAADARRSLGAGGSVLGFPVRHFPEHRQAILEQLVVFARKHSPNLVLCPSPADRHQDHETVARECLRAFRCSVWGWLLPHNVADYHVRGFIRLEARHLEKKLGAVAQYRSQALLRRPYMDPDVIRAWARTVGLQAGSLYAEGFDIMREVN